MQQEAAALADIGSPSNHQGVPQDIQDFARSSGYSVEQLTAQQEAVALAHSGEQLATPESISENLQLVGAVADTLNEACRAHVRTVLDALVATHSPSDIMVTGFHPALVRAYACNNPARCYLSAAIFNARSNLDVQFLQCASWLTHCL
jgi:gamma-glutamylcysteine synthetase